MQGKVNKVFQKNGRYSICIDDVWYGGPNAGKVKPDCNDGDQVEFEFTANGNFKNITSINVVGGGATSPASSNTSAPAGSRDVAILHQSCRKDAIALVAAALEASAMPLPAKNADKLDAVLAMVDDLTGRFFIDTTEVIAAGGVDASDIVPDAAGVDGDL